MLYINEPLLLYANNSDDLYFNLNTIFIPMIKIFLIVFIILSLIYSIIYIVNYKINKKDNIYNLVLIISFIAFFASYIQGNFLVGSLPSLDGATIPWSSYSGQNIITIIIWIILITVFVITIRKYKVNNVVKASQYVCISVFIMLFSALISTMLTHNVFNSKKVNYISKDNINNVSNNKNFYILVLDSIDSKHFYEVL